METHIVCAELERELAGFCRELGREPGETVLAMADLQTLKKERDELRAALEKVGNRGQKNFADSAK